MHKGMSAAAKFQFFITLGASNNISNATSDNVSRGLEQKRRRGELSSRAPFGYKNVELNNKRDVVVDEYAAEIVRAAFSWYATGTYSMKTLCEKLKTEYGVSWSKGYVDWLLKHPFYYGEMRHKDTLIPHKYRPLISRSLFDRVRDVKASFKKKKAKHAGIPFMYRGLFKCADCGMMITPERHKDGKFIYYHCTEYRGKHGAEWVREEDITKQLGQLLGRLRLSGELIQQLVTALTGIYGDQVGFHRTQITELERERTRTMTMIEKMYIDKLNDKVTEGMYEKLHQQFQDKLADIDARLRGLHEVDNDYYITAQYLLDIANRAHDLFMSSEDEEKRHVLNLLLSNPRLDGKKLVCDVQKPFDLIMECNDRQEWCTLLDVLLNKGVVVDIPLNQVTTARTIFSL